MKILLLTIEQAIDLVLQARRAPSATEVPLPRWQTLRASWSTLMNEAHQHGRPVV